MPVSDRRKVMAEILTVAAPPSLSARPLVWALEGRSDVRLRWEPWNTLAATLWSGEVDAALLPSIDYPRLVADVERSRSPTGSGRPAPKHFVVLPVPAITSRGAVGALRLVGYAEKDKLRRVLLDPASPTGSAMARLIILREFHITPHFVMPGETGKAASRPPDAELIAGDRAFLPVDSRAVWDFDLGAEWHRATYLPMVYAMWVARADGPLGALREILAEAASRGLEARESMAVEAAAKSRLPLEVVRRFLMDQTRYAFGPKELQGLTVFLDKVVKEGMAPEGVKVRLAPAEPPPPSAKG
jgi:chorismate dehydratase